MRIFKRKKKNGKGKVYNPDGIIIFEGEYLNDVKTGKGKEYDDNNVLSFEGDCLNGMRNGNGKEYNGEI